MTEQRTQAALSSEPAERAVLGAIMADNAVLRGLGLVPHDFAVDAHALTFEAMQRLADGLQPIDSITLREQLVRMGKLDRAGGDERLLALTDTIPNTRNAQEYARIVANKAALRRTRDALRAGLVAVERGELEDAHESARQALEERGDRDVTPMTIRQLLDAAVDASRVDSRGIGGIATGYELIDKVIGRLGPGEVITVGAPSGCGKSHLALGSVVRNVRAGRRVAVVSLEDPKHRWGRRLAAQLHKDLSVKQLQQPQLNFEQRERLQQAYTLGDRLALNYFDGYNADLNYVLRSIDRAGRDGCDMIVVDHLHAIRFKARRDYKQADLVNEAVREIKAATQSIGVVLMLVAQCGRGEKHNRFAEPTVFDLRDSSQIEIASDVILMNWKTSDQSRTPIIGKIGKLKDEEDRDRYRLVFGENGALYTLAEYEPPQDSGEGSRGGGFTRKSGGR